MRHNRALFLDRDGVVNIDHGYVHRVEDFHFHPGIFQLCRAAQTLEYRIVVVTNQAGIGRGYYTESAFVALTRWMVGRFAEEHVEIAGVYYCPCHPVDGIAGYNNDCFARKPRPGMVLRAAADLALDLTSSILVGDRESDISAARTAGVGVKILLGSRSTPNDTQQTDYHVAESLDDVRRRFFSPAGSVSHSEIARARFSAVPVHPTGRAWPNRSPKTIRT